MRFYTIAFIALFLYTTVSFAQTITLTAPPNGNNQKSSVTQWIGLVSVTITYRGPDVHNPKGEDRKGHIWGELVHYGLKDPDGYGTSVASPWRAGSNEITTITVSHDVKVNGKDLKAGTYGLMLQLEKDKPWTWIFNKNSTSWGVYYYSSDEDVLRMEANPEDCAYSEWLTYGFDNRQLLSANAYLQWENKKIPFKIEVPNGMQLYVNQMRAELTSYAGFNSENWLRCARICLSNKINLEEAIKWVDISMNSDRFTGQKTFTAMQLKADILNAMNKSTEADAVMKDAMTIATMNDIHQYGKSLLAAGKNDKALEVFKLNREKNKGDKFTTFVGLARGYAVTGNKKEAIKNWEVALKNIPENQKANTAVFQEELKKLKQ
jgi:tetratricopeptide (TPR) repeat protein